MFKRVGLIALGGVLYVILREFGLPMKLSAVLGLIPFGLYEAKNFSGPYEKTAHEIMHEQDEPASEPVKK